MKKFILVFTCLVAGLAMAQAQSGVETLTLTPVKKGEEPKEVMAAVKQDFPEAFVRNLAMLPVALYGQQWSASLDDNLNGSSAEFYQVNLKDKNGNEIYRAAYDRNGKLHSAKTVVINSALPSEVSSAIATKYPGWNLVNDYERITYKKEKTDVIFHAEIEKDKVHRSLFINNVGEIVKDVPVRGSK